MVQCKNAGGSLRDDERRLPYLTEKEKGKVPIEVMSKKKRKRGDRYIEMATVVAIVADHAERDGNVRIGDHMIAG
jgi:hypothetical protein